MAKFSERVGAFMHPERAVITPVLPPVRPDTTAERKPVISQPAIHVNNGISRRQFLGGMILTGAAVLAGAEVLDIVNSNKVNTGTNIGSYDNGQASQVPASGDIQTFQPDQTIGNLIPVKGIPDYTEHVDVAKGVFKNTIGQGTQAFLAEPGGLLVGPDFDYTGKNNPFGVNKKGWDAMYKSDGNIQTINPVTQEVMHNADFTGMIPEGGWMIVSTATTHVKMGDVEFTLPEITDNNYLLYVRGLYGDMKQNTDRNTDAVFTNYHPGHALYMMLEAADKSNVGFLSEGQFKQMAETSHTGGTNLGDGGASRLTVVYVDLNTKAAGVWTQTAGRNQDTSKVQLVYKNY
jgi:hypothetical protein